MIATALVASLIVGADFLLYPFGLETAALAFYALYPVSRHMPGVDERSWMTGSLVASAIVAGLCVMMAFEPRLTAVTAMARWSVFTAAFDMNDYLTSRAGLYVVYVNALLCFAAPALLPVLVRQYTAADLRRFPFADTTTDVTRWCVVFISMQASLLFLKVLHMVAPVVSQIPMGQPRPAYRFGPVFDAYADHALVILIVGGATYSAAILGSAWPLLARRLAGGIAKP